MKMEVKGKRKIFGEQTDIKDKKKTRLEESGGVTTSVNEVPADMPSWEGYYEALLLQLNNLVQSMTLKSQWSNFDVPPSPHRREQQGSPASGGIPKSVLTPYNEEVGKVPANVGCAEGQCMDPLFQVVSLIRSMAFESKWSNCIVAVEPMEVPEPGTILASRVEPYVALLWKLESLIRSMTLGSQCKSQDVHKTSGEGHCSIVALLSLVKSLVYSMTPKSECSSLIRQGPVLSEEIIFYEILPWLPLQSLFRFKLVCKLWNKVISRDPLLSAAHSQRCVPHPPGLLYCGLRNDRVFLDPSLKLKSIVMKDMDLIASSNGLVCASVTRGRMPYFYVRNPITHEGVYIPNSRCLEDVTLAYEPAGCRPYFALVGRQVTNVEHLVKGHIIMMGFSLYSSETGRWSVATAKVGVFRDSIGADWPRTEYRSLYAGGKVYWKIQRNVFWFDIKEDTAGGLDIPNMEFPKGEIGGFNGELSYSAISAEDIVVWVLRANEKRWVQKYCVLLTDIFKDISGNIPSCCDSAVLRLLGKRSVPSRKRNRAITGDRRPLPYEGGDLLFWGRHSLQSREGMIFSYNMETRALRILHDSQMTRVGGCLLSYQKSLASVLKLLPKKTT